MIVRKGTMEDKSEVMALYRAHIGEEGVTWDEDYPNEEIFETWDVGPGNLFCLTEEDGSIVAAVSIEDDEEANAIDVWDKSLDPALHFARVCVKKGYEGRGLARKLVEHVLEEMRRRGMRGARYLVAGENLRAQAAYRALNFRFAGKVRIYDHDYLGFEREL